MGTIVELKGVNKSYGTNHVVKDLNITVEEGEFLTLLGSSGCGKTTTLRMIAGFEEPTSGAIRVEGESIEEKEPFERNVNTVFQTYALFPHKCVPGSECPACGTPSRIRGRRWPVSATRHVRPIR